MKMIKTIKTIILILIVMWANQVLIFSEDTLSLEESIKLALENNCKVKNSTLEMKAARQEKKSAFTHYFPDVSASGMVFQAEKSIMEIHTEGGNLPVYNGNPVTIPTATQYAYLPDGITGILKKGTIGYINAVQPVFAGGRIINGNKLASLGVDASKFNDELTRNEVILKTEEHYWQIVSLEEKFKTIEKFEEMLNSLLKQVEDAYEAGVVMKNDVLKVKLKQSEIRLNKSKLKNGISLARMAFNQHLGLPLDSAPVLKFDPVVIESPVSLYVDHNEALKIRDEYKLLELSVRAEKLQTRMKRGEYLPQLGIGAALLYLKLDENAGKSIGTVYGSVSVPISDWWGGAHQLKIKNLKETIAENNLKDKSELLLLQMDKARRDLDDAYTQYQLSEESKTQAIENMKVNEDGYNNGLINVSDLLEAQALLRQSEDQVTDATTNFLLKKTEYFQATGR